jgi:Replication-relaxation
MRQLGTQHILLFRLFRDHFLFLTRSQIERILTLDTRTANRHLDWLVSEQYLSRRYRVDTFTHFQTPVYYLGKAGWNAAGCLVDDYRKYERDIAARRERSMRHTLSVYDVCLKFILNSRVRRIVSADDPIWQQSITLGNVPDCWIQFNGGEAFVEVDLGRESLRVVERKFKNYISFKESGSYGSAFPGCQFKVLFVTTTEERIESLQQITTSDDIWFGTMEEFLKEPLGHQHWFALRGFYALPDLGKKEV